MRIFLIVLLTLLLIPSLLLAGLVGTANLVFTETFIIGNLQEVNLFAQLESVLPDLIGSNNGEDPGEDSEPLLEIFLPHLEFADLLQDVSESLVQQSFGYLDGRTDSIELTLDLAPIIAQIEALIMDRDFFLQAAAEMEPGDAELLKHLSDEELLEFQLEALAGFRESDFEEQMEIDVIAILAEGNPEILDTINTVRNVYGKMRLALYIAGGICLVLFALMLMAKLVGGLIAAGIALLLTGSVFAAIPAAFDRVAVHALSELAEEVGPELFAAIQQILSNLLAVPRNIGLGYCLTGLVFIIAAIVISVLRHKKAVQTPD